MGGWKDFARQRISFRDPRWIGSTRVRMNDLPVERIRNLIHVVRGHHVVLHTDLARLYRVPTNRLLSQAQRLPGHFCFRLEGSEFLTLGDRPLDEWNRPF